MSTSVRTLTDRQLIAWRNAVFLVFCASGMELASYMARVPHIRDLLGATTAGMGVLAFATAVGSITGMLGSSHIVAALTAKRTMLYFATAICLGITLAGVGAALTSFWWIVVGLFVTGLGMGTTDVAMNVSAAANEQAIGTTIMPIFHAVFSFGTMAGAGLGALAEKLSVPIVVHLTVVSVVVAVTLWATNHHVQPEFGAGEEDHHASSTTRSRLAVWTQPGTLLIGLIVLGMALAEGSANDWLALAMVDGHGQSNALGAVSLGVFLTSMTVARLLGVRLLDRYGRVPVLRGSAVLAAGGLALVIFARHPVLVTVGVVCWGLGSALGFPVGMSAAADDMRVAAARVSAVATIGYVAFLGGPPLIGFLGQQFGLLHALLVVLVFMALAGVLAPAARENRA